MSNFKHTIETLESVRQMISKSDIPDIDEVIEDAIFWVKVREIETAKPKSCVRILWEKYEKDSINDILRRAKAEALLRGEMFNDCTLDEFAKAVDFAIETVDTVDELKKQNKTLKAINEVLSKSLEKKNQPETNDPCNDNQIINPTEQQLKTEMRQALSRKFFKLGKEEYDVDCEIDKIDTVISNMLNIYQFLFPGGEA
ncbi:MAG: hypothetical protein IJ642_14055 [Oscillospiraceae bacterium]|nr:hypothetical protein [Oscillospiraceae bacterium]MBR1530403.1 hypothetical protein [Oscillospiraceae bacterium]